MNTKRETRLEKKIASGEQLLKHTKEKTKQRLAVEKQKQAVAKQKHDETKEALKQLKHENCHLKQLRSYSVAVNIHFSVPLGTTYW